MKFMATGLTKVLKTKIIELLKVSIFLYILSFLKVILIVLVLKDVK